MDSIKSFFLHPLVLSLVFGTLIFVITYIRLPGVLRFFKNKTFSSQKEILDIVEKMLLKISPDKVVMWLWSIGLGLGFILFLVCWPNLLLGLGVGVIGFLGSWMGAQIFMRNMWETHCNKVVSQMAEGLIVMTNGVKVGLSIVQAMERTVKNIGGPLGQELQLVLNKVRLGMSVEEALTEMESRVNRQDVTMMVISINILKETGGNIAETLAVIADTIRDRQKIEQKIKALTAQGRMQSLILSAIPFIILGVMFLGNSNYARLVLTTPLGWVCLIIITGMVGIGGFLMKKLIQIKV